MGLLDKAKALLGQHDDKVDQGIDKLGDAAGRRFGHEEQIDQGAEHLKRMTGEGDTTAAPPPDAAPPPPAPEGEAPPPRP
ncbi:MT0933-like antitoxin protein [Pseudonocardia thermophila]|jgi:U5 snRNP spliceosome subunit|uniref:MT0933-like antitoxin protein n=1 Tax=Pseudonocardia thermophila TaxID=1848 RepID=A0A1M6TKZ4_PSETH|nr:antitoxin [Pseudonocardia thermophila]SHK57448.1 MT0933-like antitoxin protein [Pseudonocardia thermophila]